MDKRIHKINRLLTSYSQGQFGMRLKLDNRNDELNACMWSINILGEELEEIAITRDYFNSIFNTIEEMVIIVNSKGTLEDVNSAVCEQLGYSKEAILGQPVDILAGPNSFRLFRKLRNQDPGNGSTRLRNRFFITATGEEFPVDLHLKFIRNDPPQLARGILLTARNATERINAENAVLRAVIGALEQQRIRLARDLHDSVGQQLAASQFMVSALVRSCTDPTQLKELTSAKQTLDEAQTEMRNVCFELAPRTLAEQGLLAALRELCDHMQQAGGTKFRLFSSSFFPRLDQSIEIDLFRVVQEFFSNAVRHGAATIIELTLTCEDRKITLRLRDNGNGFDPDCPVRQGMGLQNMQTRIQSHSGRFSLTSAPGCTALEATIPLQDDIHHKNDLIWLTKENVPSESFSQTIIA